MTTREQLEAEAAELYPLDRRQRMANGEPFPRPEQAAHVRAKTISAEQRDAAITKLWHADVWEGGLNRYDSAVDIVLRAAGLLIEGEG